jgi:hypothetical protein
LQGSSAHKLPTFSENGFRQPICRARFNAAEEVRVNRKRDRRARVSQLVLDLCNYEILQKTGGQAESEDEEAGEPAAEDANGEAEEGTGSKVRLRPWNRRVRKSMGYDGDGGTAAGKPAPLIDQVHRMMHLWKAGDLTGEGI